MIKNELISLAETITGGTVTASSILDALNAIASFYAGETVKAANISAALNSIATNYSSSAETTETPTENNGEG